MQSKANFEYLKHISETADRRAILADLMTHYGNDVWNFAYIMTKDRATADAITEELFVSIYERPLSCRSAASIQVWLLEKTRLAANGHKKSIRFKLFLPKRLFQRQKLTLAEQTDAASELWRLVLRLPVKYREVLVLQAHYKCSCEEICKIVGISENSVQRRLHIARTKILDMKESASFGSIKA